MRYLLALLIAAAFTGCATRAERAQHAAEADSAVQAISLNLADMLPAIRALSDAEARAKLLPLAQVSADIAGTVRGYLPAVADVPKAELPAPKQTPEQIRADGGSALKAATPPDPTNAGLIAILGTAGLALLYGVGKVAPGIPGLGPVVGGIANLAWSTLAHRDQIAADKAQAAVAEAAAVAGPLLAQIQALPPGTLPSHVQIMLNDPVVTAAVTALAKG